MFVKFSLDATEMEVKIQITRIWCPIFCLKMDESTEQGVWNFSKELKVAYKYKQNWDSVF